MDKVFIYAIAADSFSDPRTVRKVVDGDASVRPMVRARILAAIRARGVALPRPDSTPPHAA